MANFNYLGVSDLSYALNLRTGAGIRVDLEEQFTDHYELSPEANRLWRLHFKGMTLTKDTE